MRTLAALAIVLAACAPTPPGVGPRSETDLEGELSLATTDPGGIDPQESTLVNSARVALLVYEPLLSTDPQTLRPVSGAADLPLVLDGGLRLRFTLRAGLTYSDGAPLRARDFAYGISRLCDPSAGVSTYVPVAIVGCADWYALDPVKATADQLLIARRTLLTTGIVALSDRDLELHLRYPAPYLIGALTLWNATPVRESDLAREGDNWALDPANYIGNGPFVLTEWIMDKRMVFERNPRFHARAKLKRLTLLFFKDESSRLDAYRQGKVDLMAVSAETAADVKRAGLEPELAIEPGSCTQWVRLNHARAPLDDQKVRMALAKAIDRDAYVTEVLPFGRPATSFIPYGLPGHDLTDDAQVYDLAAARRLLSESRYAGGPELHGMVWQIGSGQPSSARTRAEWIVNRWRALGIEVALQVIPQGMWAANNRSLTTRSLFRVDAWCADYPDQQDWLSITFTTKVQRGVADWGYRNAEVDALLGQADAGLDAATRDGLYERASRILSADVAGIWLGYQSNVWLRKPWVGGIAANPLNFGGMLYPGDVFIRPH